MGKGQIVSGGESGMYQVKLIYAYRSRVEQKITKAQQGITAIESQIVTLDAQIAAETDQKKKENLIIKKSVLNLQITSLNKQIEYLQNNMPADPTISAWCADLTEDLSGDVGTIEIPGEVGTVLIRPGTDGGATYSGARDGQLMPSIAGEPHQVLFNWMLLPGWQRHKPIYRAGTIVPDSIDFDANTCSVCLDPAYSSQQSLPAVDGLAVGDCNMGDDDQSQYLTDSAEDFCGRYSGHPFCTQSPGSEITLTDGMLAQLRDINFLVNGGYGRANDKSGVRVGDKWDVMGPGGSGDCEDFALTKMQMLVTTYGWNPNSLNLVTAFAKNGEYHAMLGIRTKNRGLVVLDVNYDEVMESGRVPYRIDKIALASDDWRNYTRRLEDVPIEYMTCNANAFADGDRVVVEFTGQNWNSPKVIGFLENPQQCGLDIIYLMGRNGSSIWEGEWSFVKYYVEADLWVGNENIPGNYLNGEEWFGDPTYPEQTIRDNFFSSQTNSSTFIFGGVGEYSITGPYPEMYLYRADRRDNSTAAWTQLQDLPERRAQGQGFSVGGNHYVVSGGTNNYLGTDGETQFGVYGEVYTSNYMFENSSNSWTSKQDVTLGGLQNRSFTIDDVAFFMLGYGSSQWNPGGLDAYFPVFPKPASWMPSDMLSYVHGSDSWSFKQNMLRGLSGNGAATVSAHGYIAPGIANGVQRSGEREGFYVIGGDEYNPPQILHYGWYSEDWEKYAKDSDSWSIFLNDNIPDEDYTDSNITGGFNGKSQDIFGYFGRWAKISTVDSTVTQLTQRLYLSNNIFYNRLAGF